MANQIIEVYKQGPQGPAGADGVVANLGSIPDVDLSTPAEEGQGLSLQAGVWAPEYLAKARGLNPNVLGWKDIIGAYSEDTSGPTRPSKSPFKNPVDAFSYGVNDAGEYSFHLPHDYAPGTDLFLHVHWGHNGTAISGNMVWTITATLANREAGPPYSTFSPNITSTINSNTLSGVMNITNFPQHCHVVEEIQLSSLIPSASLLDTSDVGVDSVIIVHIAASTVPNISGGTPNDPYLFNLDIHYQAGCMATLNKEPNFYA